RTAALAYPLAGTRFERGELDADARLADVERGPGRQYTPSAFPAHSQRIPSALPAHSPLAPPELPAHSARTARVDGRKKRAISRRSKLANRENMRQPPALVTHVKSAAPLFQLPGNCARIGIHSGKRRLSSRT